MQNFKYISLFTLLLTACGSAGNTFSQEGTHVAGSAGNAEIAGSAGSSGAGSEAGGANNSAGSSGKESSAGTAGDSMNAAGANMGGMNASGSAGMNSAGTAGINTAGSGGSCNPITCDDYSLSHGKTKDPNIFKKSCGFIDDGCGHKIQCGGCPDFTKCGDIDRLTIQEPNSNYYFQSDSQNSDANTCNGFCVRPINALPQGLALCSASIQNNTNPPISSMYGREYVCFNPGSNGSVPSSICKNAGFSVGTYTNATQNSSLNSQTIEVSAEVFCCAGSI